MAEPVPAPDNLAPQAEAGIQVRRFNWKQDREVVLSFQRDTYELNFPGFVVTDSFLHDFARALRYADRNSNEALFVLEDHGTVCGFLWLALVATMPDPCVGFIKNVYVAPEYRGRRLGRLLLQKADEWFQQQGVLKAHLTASTVNPVAIKLYENCGYEVIRVRMEKRYEEPGPGRLQRWLEYDESDV